MSNRLLTYPGESRFLFLSDVHLGAFGAENDRHIEDDLIELIDFAEQRGYRLLLLGDIFDYWMEYETTFPQLGRRVLNRLENYNRRQGSTLFITGNHDHWVGSHLANHGFDLESDYRILQIGNRNLFLHHGDGVSDPELNLPRPLFHRILRNPSFVRLYQRLLPARHGLKLMRLFSQMSRRMTGNNTEQIRVLDRWARVQLEARPFHAIICGHDHMPRHRNYQGGEYLNLGTFFEHRTLGCYTNGQLQLVEWNGHTKELQPVPGTAPAYT